MERERLYHRRNIVACILAVLVMLAALFFCFSGMNNINLHMNESATSNLLNTTRVIEGNLENYFEKDFESLSIVGEIYKSGTLKENGELEALCSTMGFERIGIVNAPDLPEQNQWNPGERGYSDAYFGESGRLQTTLWVPFYRGGTFAGVVYGDILLTKYYSANVFTFYDGDGRTYLFDGTDGSWILKSLGRDGTTGRSEDIYSLLLRSGNSSEEVLEFRQAVEARKTGTAAFFFNDEQSYICFMPLSSSPDWYVATVIGRDTLLKESNQVRRMIQMILLVFCSVLLILAVAFVKWQGRMTKIREANYREAMFDNISSNIDSVFLIYEKESKKTVFVSDNVNRLLGLERNWLRKDAGNLFEWCGIGPADPDRSAFLNGTLERSVIREACVENEMGIKSRYIRLELIPADLGQEIAVLTDVTKDKDMQDSLLDAMRHAEAASQAKNDFLSAMSHDIRTPLNGVMGMTAIAGAHLDDQNRVKDCLAKINDASEHLMHLINEVLDMSRIESGKMELSEEPFNLLELIRTVLNMNYPGIKEKNHVIKTSIHSIEHENVIGDSMRLQRIVSNLISNAIKYTPDHGRITLSLQEKPAVISGYGCYELIVEDNGIGMSREFIQRAFEPFEREEDVRTSKVQGTGLGMSIVKNIVALMMGDIRIESEKGIGSKVFVTVNLKLDKDKGEAQPGQVQESLEACQEITGGGIPDGKRILLAEDNELNREIAVEFLQILGVDTDTAEDGAEAAALFARSNPGAYDLIIMDIQMPGMNGYEASKAIRSMDRPDSRRIPIVAMTADAFAQDIQAARMAGMDAHLAKPVSMERLEQMLIRFLSGQEGKREGDSNDKEGF